MALDTELRRAGEVERQHSPPSPHRIEVDDDEHVANRTLKFSIENILRPDFGKGALRKEDQTDDDDEGGDESRESCGSSGGGSAGIPAAREASSPADKTKETASASSAKSNFPKPMLWPAWVYCTRYSDRPSSGPRSRRMKKKEKKPEEKRPRTAFTNEQLARLKKEFQENRYLTEKRRQDLAKELKLNESQIKIWFQNKRAKIKKASGQRNSLALQLMAQGLYNHTTVPPNSDGKTFAVDE